MRSILRLVTFLTITLSAGRGVADQPSLAGDQQTVYRISPRGDNTQLIRVPPEEIKQGFTYNYYSPVLKHRVWGFATEDHSFEYAFGEGTIIPTNRFDLRLSEEAQEKILEERQPRLKQTIEGLGRSPAVQLNAANEWSLLSYPSSARVFDLLTGQRWEWHGKRRLGVVNVDGNLWQIVEGKYKPLDVEWAICQ